MTKLKFTKKDVGCWVDDNRGIYMGERIQQIAEEYGWDGEPLNVDAEFYDEATDEAIDYLNSLCDDTVTFTTESGPFCLIEVEQEEG